MNVLMFMFAGSDTSRESHKVLLGMLPDLPPTILDKVCSMHLQQFTPRPLLRCTNLQKSVIGWVRTF